MHELAAECSEAIALLLAADKDAEVPPWLAESVEEVCGV